MTTIIRPVHIRSLPNLQRLFQKALDSDFGYFPPSYHQKVLEQNRLRHFALSKLRPGRILLGAYNNNELTGYSISNCKDGAAFLFWMYIAPDRRGQGAGRELLAATEQACSSHGATSLRLVTHEHRKYYQRNGFAWIETVAESDKNIPMYVMEKQLSG